MRVALQGRLDPAARTPRRPSIWLTTLPPSPMSVLCRCRPTPPVPLRAFADSAPIDWLVGSILDRSNARPHKSPPAHGGGDGLGFRTSDGCICLPGDPLEFCSSRSEAAVFHRRRATVNPKDASPDS